MIRRLWKVLLPLAILAGAVAGAGYLSATRPRVEPLPVSERAWTVAVVPAARLDIRPEMRFFGEIVAGREVELRPLVEGRIVEVGPDFVEGGVVRAGDLIVAIDAFDYRAAIDEFEARIAEARGRLAEISAQLVAAGELLEHDNEQLDLSRRNLKRRETLRGTPAASEKLLDDARMDVSKYKQQVITRQETIDRLSAVARQQEAVVSRWQVALRRARRDLDQTRLTAPFDGFLVDTDAAIGKRVARGDRLARLIDAGRLEARFHASDARFARLLAAGGYRDRPARVVWRVGDRTFDFEATIERIESQFNAESGGVDLFARIADTGVEGALRSGAFVEVWVADRLYTDVVRLPESAVHEGDTVYVVVDGRLAPRRVEVVVRSGADIIVRGDLGAGDRVVTTRFPVIGPGVKVVVR